MNKLILTILLTLGASVSFGADRDKAKAATDELGQYVTRSQHVDPTNALYYQSDRDDVDNHVRGFGLSLIKNANSTVIERSSTESVAISSCTADYGTVSFNNTSTPKTVTINSSRRPVRVLCTTLDGKTRIFFTTYR